MVIGGSLPGRGWSRPLKWDCQAGSRSSREVSGVAQSEPWRVELSET